MLLPFMVAIQGREEKNSSRRPLGTAIEFAPSAEEAERPHKDFGKIAHAGEAISVDMAKKILEVALAAARGTSCTIVIKEDLTLKEARDLYREKRRHEEGGRRVQHAKQDAQAKSADT